MPVSSKTAKPTPAARATKKLSPLRVPCDSRAAYDWRFNLEGMAKVTRIDAIVMSACQGNVIRRRMYTVTQRKRDFNICRRHQVEVGSMVKVGLKPGRTTI